jgi:hypothetical protein
VSLVQAVSKNLTVAAVTQTTTAIATTPGNCLVFCAAYNGAAAGTVTPSDSTGLTWVRAPGSPFSGAATGLTLDVWLARNIAGNAANTFTLATQNNDTPSIIIAEFSGRDKVTPLDVAVQASDAVATSGAHTTGAITPQAVNDDLLSFNVASTVAQNFSSIGGWSTPPNGTVTTAPGYDCFLQYQNNVNVPGTVSNTYSVTLSDKLDAFIIALRVPPQPYGDENFDFFSEEPEVYEHRAAYQQADVQPLIADADQDWNDECGEGDAWALVEDQSGAVEASVVPNIATQYYAEDMEQFDEAIELVTFASSYQQRDVFPITQPEDVWDWFTEVDDDGWLALSMDVIVGQFVDPTSLVLEGLTDWDEDPDDFFADDFGNDDADLPVADAWDHFVTDDDEWPAGVEDFANAYEPQIEDGWTEHCPTDDDDYLVVDDYALQTNVGPTPITVEDPWDWEQGDDDYAVSDDPVGTDNNPLLNSEDPTWWDEEPDQDDGTAHDLDEVCPDNNPIIILEDGWAEHWPTDDDDYVVVDDYAIVDVIPVITLNIEDGWDFFSQDPDDELFLVLNTDPVGTSVIVAPSMPVEDPTDWTQDDDHYATPDDYAIVDVAQSLQVPVEDVGDWTQDDDDYFVDDGYQQFNNTPIVVEDAWDWATQETEEEPSLETDPVAAPQAMAFDDAWDWTQDDDEQLPLFDALMPPQAMAFDDAWDWTQDDEEALAFFNTDTLAPAPPAIAEDAWDWSQDDGDSETMFAGDQQPVDTFVPPSQFTDEAWDWFYESAEDNEQDFAVTDGPLPLNVYLFNPNWEVKMRYRSFMVTWLPEDID